MKTIRFILLCGILSAIVIPAALQAQPKIGSFGFGLILGEPTGLTLKGSAGRANSWDLAVGSSWFGNLRVHGDYLWNVDAFSSNKVGLYFGLGAAVGIGRGKGVFIKGEKNRWYYYDDEDALALGIRGVAGLNAMPFSAPVEMFFEVAPLVGITPVTGLGTDVAIGIRYYP